MVVPNKADGAALFWKSGGLPISYECRKRKNELKCLLTLPSWQEESHWSPRTTSTTHFPPTLLIRVILFASQVPLLCSNVISICLNTSFIPPKKNIRIYSNQSVLTSTSWKTLFSSSLFRFNATFWVALPQLLEERQQNRLKQIKVK